MSFYRRSVFFCFVIRRVTKLLRSCFILASTRLCRITLFFSVGSWGEDRGGDGKAKSNSSEGYHAGHVEPGGVLHRHWDKLNMKSNEYFLYILWSGNFGKRKVLEWYRKSFSRLGFCETQKIDYVKLEERRAKLPEPASPLLICLWVRRSKWSVPLRPIAVRKSVPALPGQARKNTENTQNGCDPKSLRHKVTVLHLG